MVAASAQSQLYIYTFLAAYFSHTFSHTHILQEDTQLLFSIGVYD